MVSPSLLTPYTAGMILQTLKQFFSSHVEDFGRAVAGSLIHTFRPPTTLCVQLQYPPDALDEAYIAWLSIVLQPASKVLSRMPTSSN